MNFAAVRATAIHTEEVCAARPAGSGELAWARPSGRIRIFPRRRDPAISEPGEGHRPVASKSRPAFDPKSFLAKVGDGRSIGKYPKDEIVFSQGDPADAVFYIQKGKVKLTV